MSRKLRAQILNTKIRRPLETYAKNAQYSYSQGLLHRAGKVIGCLSLNMDFLPKIKLKSLFNLGGEIL